MSISLQYIGLLVFVGVNLFFRTAYLYNSNTKYAIICIISITETILVLQKKITFTVSLICILGYSLSGAKNIIGRPGLTSLQMPADSVSSRIAPR